MHQTTSHVDSRPFDEEKEYVQQNGSRLEAEYGGHYIAVIAGSVVDSDKDFSALAERVFSKFGYKPIFMPLIERNRRVYRIPGPRMTK